MEDSTASVFLTELERHDPERGRQAVEMLARRHPSGFFPTLPDLVRALDTVGQAGGRVLSGRPVLPAGTSVADLEAKRDELLAKGGRYSEIAARAIDRQLERLKAGT